MRTVNNRLYSGALIKAEHTLKQMENFVSRSKGATRDYWIARIENYKKGCEHDKS